MVDAEWTKFPHRPRLGDRDDRGNRGDQRCQGLGVVALWTLGALLLGALVLKFRDA
jgi:hypothetical protein